MASNLIPIPFVHAVILALLALTVAPRSLFSPSTINSLLHQRAVLEELHAILSDNKVLLLFLCWCSAVLVVIYFSTRPIPVLLLDYSCYKPDADRRCSYEVSEYFVRRSRRFSQVSEEFTREIYRKSGLGDETYAPPFLFQPGCDATLASAVQEAKEGMLSVVDSLLSKVLIRPSRVDVLVVTCSMFWPCPSLTSMLVHRYGFKPSIKTFNFSGMGCSAGGMAIDAVAKILRRKSGYGLVVTTESTSLNWYFGDERSMIVTNCIFRVGAAAVLLTSDRTQRGAAKMELVRTLRTHHGIDDASYGAAVQREDNDGNVGVALSKDLVRVAGAGLRSHIATLAPRVLPVSELLRYVYAVARSMLQLQRRYRAGAEEAEKRQPHQVVGHVPDFTKAFEHMCLHPGGKAVVNAVGRLMGLAEVVVEPARMTLHRFGNTSSSSVFYELAYFEAKGRVRKGDRVWMLSFGTGFKACSLVWRALQDSRFDPDNPWNDCIVRYPVQLV
ncbi:hypothetical protein Taro_046414 [Colocasia esculenta]|uniref:3-ketoacyl-CoA synthase n=1 Tax=Colocasia esculenta TaxID=4460 RepID=A0A843X7D6_COLES|nr:hypothetical protein [Colocasia esculenta]